MIFPHFRNLDTHLGIKKACKIINSEKGIFLYTYWIKWKLTKIEFLPFWGESLDILPQISIIANNSKAVRSSNTLLLSEQINSTMHEKFLISELKYAYKLHPFLNYAYGIQEWRGETRYKKYWYKCCVCYNTLCELNRRKIRGSSRSLQGNMTNAQFEDMGHFHIMAVSRKWRESGN